MFAKTLFIATLSILSVASVQANEVTPDVSRQFTSTLTRAEVRQATLDALRAGAARGGDRTEFVEPIGMSKSRVQVVAETLQAIRLGLVGQGERSVFPTEAQLESIRMAGLLAVNMNLAAR